ncbi:ATP-dependent Clp protease ATP-binding subunit ClpC [candidate division SR1 bacterium Aalborg_AAW-1]|nr:ATP-dependent Clp protease ATP-binding subunit ClpC [candidate division SR1 bacterium Aalborg_AAW-1]
MQQPFKNCILTDHIDTLFYLIQQQQTKQNHTLARGEDMIRGLIERSPRYPEMFSLFWKLVGISDTKNFLNYFKLYSSSYPQSDIPSVAFAGSQQSLLIPEFINKNHTILSKQGLHYLDFFAVWYGAIHDLSPTFKKYCKENNISVKNIISQTHRLSENNILLQSGSFAFFNIVTTLMKRLSLQADDIAMLSITNSQEIDTLIEAFGVQSEQQFVEDSDGKLFPHNNYESDVIDQEDQEKTNSTTEKKAKEKKLMVDIYGTDLTNEAKEGRLDPVIGRQQEIEQMTYTLLRKTKSNPLLIGEAGVGKTAVVEGLAQHIAAGTVPEKLKNKRIVMLDISSIVAGTKYRGDFEARFKAIMEEATDPTNNIILFIDEIHTMIGAGGAAGTDDAAQLIKPLLARGRLKLIAATTFDEYQQHIEKDAALKRRFQEVYINEPTLEDTKTILLGLKSHFEEFHNVHITDESIDSAINLAQRYIMNKYFPDKAIDIIDEAAARASTFTTLVEQDEHHQSINKEIITLGEEIQKAITEQDYFLAAELKLKEKQLKDKLHTVRSSKALPLHLRPVVDKEDVGRVLADKTGVPTSIVTESEIEKLQRLKNHLSTKILGQDEAVESVVKTLQRSRLSVVEKNKPIASFLFLGPSGVGKTYLAKLIAQDYFGDEKALIRVDMSEFMESYTVSKLIGSAPGYVGYESGGGLTEQVRRKPYSVILLDEIEKANRDVLNILLQILDEGQIKDNKGRVISFKSTIIIMTSNLGAEEFGKKKASIGFGDHNTNEKNGEYSDSDRKQITTKVKEHVKEFISPELQNRIDYSIIFKPITKPLLQDIFKIRLQEFLRIWSQKSGLKIPHYSDKKISTIIDDIYNPQFGARPIDKYIYDTIEPELIDQIMNNSTSHTSTKTKSK